MIPVKLPPDKHTVLSNFLLDNNIKSDMVEAIAHVPFSMHQYYCTPNRKLRLYNCTLKQIYCAPKMVEVGVHVPSNEKNCGHAEQMCCVT